jgi:vacuolar iron transporter family protein
MARRSMVPGAGLHAHFLSERHRSRHTGWLRAAVLGANDGILSTASLVLGVAAANADRNAILVAGVAGLVAGAMSMAAGEYVSVSSQSDTEQADLERERKEIATDVEHEHRELAAIYVNRGLEPALAHQVAEQLMAKDALGAHARDELGITSRGRARPVQAAFTSAASFAVGAALPLLTAVLAPMAWLTPAVAGTALVFLATLGALAANAGGAPLASGALRVTFWGALAMLVTTAVGTAFGTAVG